MLGFFPLLAAGVVAVGYGAILHHLTLEVGLRPVLIDINRAVPPSLANRVDAVPLRMRLLAVLPMINVITGLVVAAVAGAGQPRRRGARRDRRRDDDLARADDPALALDPAAARRPPGGDRRVGEGDYDVAVPVTTADEIGELAASFNGMVPGLRERERIREAFGTYLDEEVAEYILSDGFSERGEAVDVSILFCDVKDFSGYAASAPAREVVACLNTLFEVVVPMIAAEGGHVDKFEGDGLMAVFGAPQPFADHADRAVRAAIEIDRRVNREGEGGRFELGVGVNTGRVIAGSVGGAGRLNFSVIGDAVNVAARVEAATREIGDDVLITEATHERLREDFGLQLARRARRCAGSSGRSSSTRCRGDSVEGLRDPVGAVRAVLCSRPWQPRRGEQEGVANPGARHGGRLAAKALKARGVTHLFTLSGGHLFSLYDGCREEGIEVIDVRHEQAAAFAAEGWAKATRTPGVCALTAGPGVTNGMSAIASARSNGTPIVVLGGRAPEMRWGSGSLQEIDHLPFVSPLTKSAETVKEAELIGDATVRAFDLAGAAPTGPTFLDYPLDIVFIEADADIPDAPAAAAPEVAADVEEARRRCSPAPSARRSWPAPASTGRTGRGRCASSPSARGSPST